ncbi:DUF2388 domain-containing protein [Bdellovibrio sp. HCB209]|uniref:DUF2388 domain-containing protein n=1 Tax=Bdellovibrio sp. HCB209 TaxID=3394354 RepID=UPI0039B6A7A0
MKKAVLTAIVMLTSVSAMAQYYPGPVPPPPPGPVYYPGGGYHGGGGYHNGGRSDQDDAMSAMSAATGAMFLSLASICASGPGCYYKQVIQAAKEDAVQYLADGEMRPKLAKAIEELKKAVPTDKSSEEALALAIVEFKE